MIKLSNFYDAGLTPTWGTLLLGWEGFCHFNPLISFKEIEKFAEEWLIKTNKYDELVSELLFLTGEEKYAISDILKKLSYLEKCSLAFEERKWRYLLLLNLLKKLTGATEDYLNGLLELTSFWGMFNFPLDSPHIIQGKNNSIPPTEYYSKENFHKELAIHHKWLKTEYKELKKIESQKIFSMPPDSDS